MDFEKAVNAENRARLPGYSWELIRERILDRDEHTCSSCNDLAKEVDHRIPVALGGSDSDENLQSLCKVCHVKKTRIDMEEIKRVKHYRKLQEWRED